MPTITTVLPTYKRPELLARAIESIRSQSWTDVAIVVRDNDVAGDPAVAPELLHSDQRITYVKNVSNVGAHENFRIGIRNIDTEFFSLLSDDDYLAPGFYSEAMRLFDQFPSAGFVAFRVDLVDIDGKVVGSNFPGFQVSDKTTATYYDPADGFDGFMRGVFPCTWTGFVFREAVAKDIDLGDLVETGSGADIRFIWRAASRFPCVITNAKGANFTVHSGSYTDESVFDERFQYWLRQRFRAISNDTRVEEGIRRRLFGYYCDKSALSLSSAKYYFLHAARLIARRIKAGEKEQLKFDLRAMRNFLPFGTPLLLRMMVSLAILLRLEGPVKRMLGGNT